MDLRARNRIQRWQSFAECSRRREDGVHPAVDESMKNIILPRHAHVNAEKEFSLLFTPECQRGGPNILVKVGMKDLNIMLKDERFDEPDRRQTYGGITRQMRIPNAVLDQKCFDFRIVIADGVDFAPGVLQF